MIIIDEDKAMLIVPIKRKWFDMILSGAKKEEYRDIKPYWRSRLYNEGFVDRYGLPVPWQAPVMFRNGYGRAASCFTALCSADVRHGKPEWGAELHREYYVLKILKIINRK